MAKKDLYIIGNGFDLHHGLQTRYQLFAFFLQDNYEDLYDLLITYYPLPDIDRHDLNDPWDPLWAEFEKRMAEMSYQDVLNDNSHLRANTMDENFRDSMWTDYQVGMEGVVDKLTVNVFVAFKEFIKAVDYPSNIAAKQLKLDTNGFYISFNYTDTLERYYGIPANQILYIHEKAADPNSVLILGHGIDPDHFKEKEPQPPEGLNDEEMYDWQQHMADNYDHSYDLAKREILGYFRNSFKDTQQVIKKCAPFFESVMDAGHIITMGHSLSDVDRPYLQHVANINANTAKWSVSYWSDYEKKENRARIESLGVTSSQIEMFKLEEWLVDPPAAPATTV